MPTNRNIEPRKENDFYPTPISHVRTALSLIPAHVQPKRILDPGAGCGVWGDAARDLYPEAHIIGCELQESFLVGNELYRIKKPQTYNEWHNQDFLTTTQQTYNGTFDCIIANPPYILAENFIRHSLDLLDDGGWMVMLLLLGFLAGQSRGEGFWQEYPPVNLGICSDRPSFSGYWAFSPITLEPIFIRNGSTDARDYGYYVWQKGSYGIPTISWHNSKHTNWEYEKGLRNGSI